MKLYSNNAEGMNSVNYDLENSFSISDPVFTHALAIIRALMGLYTFVTIIVVSSLKRSHWTRMSQEPKALAALHLLVADNDECASRTMHRFNAAEGL